MSTPLPFPPPPGPVFLVGIGGIGMSGLAQKLRRQGYLVAGSDRQLSGPGRDQLISSLRLQGIDIYPQDGSGVLGTEPVAIIASAAVEEGNPDFQAAPEVPRFGRAEALSAALGKSDTKLIAIAGSCGKTTVTGWLASSLRALGHSVEMVCGGYVLDSIGPEIPGNYDSDPGPEYSVVEVDESDKSLVQFSPDLGVLLNVGHDHHSHEELLQVFGQFLDRCQSGMVLGSPLRPLLGGHGPESQTSFGRSEEGGTVTLGDYSSTPSGIRFELSGIGACTSGQMGQHSALNATAVAATLLQLGECPERIPKALASFSGIAQRFQRMSDGVNRGIPVYLDYAHNPEKIRAALETAREADDGPVLAAFQPHGYGPLGFMRDELRAVLAQTLQPSDLFVMLPVYYAGGTTSFRPTAAEVAADYASAGLPVCTVHTRDALVAKAGEFAAPARLAVIMGARDPSLPQWASDLAAAL